MPLVTITTRTNRTREQKDALIQSVHQSLVESFQIPPTDTFCRIISLEPLDFIVPPGKSAAFVLVEIQAFPGRSLDAKRSLYAGIVTRLQQIGIEPTDVFIVLQEPSLENWGIRGGIPASEVNLGFKVDV